MQLFINNREVYLEEELRPNLTLQWLDTFNPSAVKTDYSKTISIPDCIQNAGIFHLDSTDNNTWTLWDNGQVIQKGYLTIDSVVEDGGLKHYNITLYGELNNFFYNLKGDTNNTKKLSDLWFKFDGLSREEEQGKILKWNIDSVYEGWERLWSGSKARTGIRSSGSRYDTFVAIPCEYKDSKIEKEKTLFQLTDDSFPTASLNNPDARVWTDNNGKRCLVLEHEEYTSYDRGDYRTDMMPIGIRYRDIIRACCDPDNNGGYKVELDPTFFNENNPYYNDLFVLTKQPVKSYEGASIGIVQNLSGSCTILKGQSYASSFLHVSTPSNPGWSNNRDNLVASPGCLSTEIRVNAVPAIRIPDLPGETNHYAELINTSYWVDVIDNDTNKTIATLTGDIGGYGILEKVAGTTDWYTISLAKPDLGPYDPVHDTTLHLSKKFPGEYTSVRVRVGISNPGGQMKICHFTEDQYITQEGVEMTLVPDGGEMFTFNTYFSQTGTATYDSIYGIGDLVSEMGSPFDYLIWFTRMFNLRFYVDSSEKKVYIIQGNNWINKDDIVDLRDKIDYNLEYVSRPRISNKKYLKFGLKYDKNDTLEAMAKEKEPFTRTLTINNFRYINDTENYVNTDLKIGYTEDRSVINSNAYRSPDYPLVNQATGLALDYITSDPYAGGSIVSDDYSGSFNNERYVKKEITTLSDITNDILLYTPYRTATEGPESEASGFDVRTISTTSQNMVVFAGGKPCYLQGRGNSILGTPDLLRCKTKSFKTSEMSVPCFLSYDPYTRKELGYTSTVSTVSCSNMYDYFSDFIKRIYSDPEEVECYVRFTDVPNLRSLYYFENQYWMLTKVTDYNYKDEPVRCTFVKYNINV